MRGAAALCAVSTTRWLAFPLLHFKVEPALFYFVIEQLSLSWLNDYLDSLDSTAWHTRNYTVSLDQGCCRQAVLDPQFIRCLICNDRVDQATTA